MVTVLALCAESPDAVYGGMGIHCRNLYGAMTGADVTYLTLTGNYVQDDKPYRLRHPTVPTYGKPRRGRERMQEHSRAMLIEGLRCEFDVIHAHDWSVLQAAFDLREVTGKPMVTTFHLFQHQILIVEGLPPTPEVQFSIEMEGNGIYHSDSVIVCSSQMRDYVKRKMGIERPMTIIPNAVNLTEFDVEPVKIDTDRPVVLFCGRLSKQKGIEHILDAVEQIDDYCFVILAGFATKDPNPQHVLDTRIRALEAKYPKRIKWVGHIEGPSRFAWHKRADVGIMPSLCEPFGIAALEFFAAGTPLVTTGIDGMRDFVSYENAYLIPGPSAEYILDGIHRAMTSEGCMMGRSIVTAARAVAAHLSWEEIAARTVKVYEEACHAK